jgi:hypothetical protein
MRTDPKSSSARPLFSVAPPVGSLNIVGMIVPPRSAHASGINVIGYGVAVVSEFFIVDRTLAVLGHNLLVQLLSHFRVRADLPISSWVVGIVDATDFQLPCSSDL